MLSTHNRPEHPDVKLIPKHYKVFQGGHNGASETDADTGNDNQRLSIRLL